MTRLTKLLSAVIPEVNGGGEAELRALGDQREKVKIRHAVQAVGG